MSDESEADDDPEREIYIPPFKKPIIQPVSVEDEAISRHPAEAFQDDLGAVVSPVDHFSKIPNVPFKVPVARKNRLVARHEMEGTPLPGNNTEASASGQGTGGGGGGGETQNAQNIQVIFDMLDCFEITCNADGTLSWTFECDDEE